MIDTDYEDLLAELGWLYGRVEDLTRQRKLDDFQKATALARLQAIEKLLADPEPRWGIVGLLLGAVAAVGGGVIAVNSFLNATDEMLERTGQRPVHEQIQKLLKEAPESSSDLSPNLETTKPPEEDVPYLVEGHEVGIAEKNGDGGTIKTKDGRTINYIRRSDEHHIWDEDPNNWYTWKLLLEQGVTYCLDRFRITPY